MVGDLPEWAQRELGKMGIEDTSAFEDNLYGPIAERKSGLRRDDLVELLLDSTVISDKMDPWVRGRLLSSHKSSIEILDDEGRFRAIAREIIVEVRLIAHTRPLYIDDEELMTFERSEARRRSEIQEEVEKRASDSHESHQWG
ncbi:MAG: hypothetical protein CMB72_03400 [Euryarchaeota archaeon]|nr:hypothetical protein [Euryarchaeota archaeon]|tara:strand:+ start:915 stop:1343 length:429 start_codon:yes stop_codon:yes gene_type:complete